MAVRFDPVRVAHFEAAGWRAYYDHRWLAVVVLMVRLCHEQFRLPWPAAIVAAYHVGRASIAWAPADNDPPTVERHLRSFYRLVRRYADLEFDPGHAAALEVRYWAEHRRLVGQPDKQPFLDALTDLHAHVFSLPPEAARESARYRVEASNAVDRITGHTSADPEADWSSLEQDLVRCYRAVAAAAEPTPR